MRVIRPLSCFLFTAIALLFSIFPIETIRYGNKPSIGLNDNKVVSSRILYSYLDAMEPYYNEVLDYSKSKGEEFVTFEEFVENYYETDLSISEYVQDLKQKVDGNFSSIIPYSSTTADYILIDGEFQRVPNYYSSDIQPFIDNLKYGCILYETRTILNNVGHTAILTGIHDSRWGYYFGTIEAVAPIVSRGFVDSDRMIHYRCVVLDIVGATNDVREKAIEFCEGQLGKPYRYDVSKNTSYDTTQWYCSELLYAAYYNQGIDIEIDKDGKRGGLGVMPADILNGVNTLQIF